MGQFESSTWEVIFKLKALIKSIYCAESSSCARKGTLKEKALKKEEFDMLKAVL